MAGCQIKRGFFVLRDCAQPAIGECSSCGRAICRECRAPTMSTTLCVDCYGRQQNNDDDMDWFTGHSIYGYRHGYYTSHAYAPVYFGGYHDSYYDEYDVRSFERGADDGDIGGGHDDADFYAS